jgi:hypothetical protein
MDGDGQGGERIDIGAFEAQAVLAPLMGDYNYDGAVDAADYVVWRHTLGTPVVDVYAGADGNGNGLVDPADHGVWRAHFGQSLSPPGTSVAADGVAPPRESATSPTAGLPHDAAFESYGRAHARAQETNALHIVNLHSTIGSPRSRLVGLGSPALLQAVARDDLLLVALSPAADGDGTGGETAFRLADRAKVSARSAVDVRDHVFELLANHWTQESAGFAPASVSEMSW